MFPDWVVEILKQYGLAGIVIAALSWRVYRQDKNAFEVNNHRLAERDNFARVVEANTTAIRDNVEVTKQRNEVTQELAEAIAKQAAAFDLFFQKTEFNQGTMKEAIQAQTTVFKEFSESIRVNSGVVRDVRDFIERQRE